MSIHMLVRVSDAHCHMPASSTTFLCAILCTLLCSTVTMQQEELHHEDLMELEAWRKDKEKQE